jgi:hypothetical protein
MQVAGGLDAGKNSFFVGLGHCDNSSENKVFGDQSLVISKKTKNCSLVTDNYFHSRCRPIWDCRTLNIGHT